MKMFENIEIGKGELRTLTLPLNSGETVNPLNRSILKRSMRSDSIGLCND